MTGSTPAQSTAADVMICSYCERPMDDGESHLHGGQPGPDGPISHDPVWAAAVARYHAATHQAFLEYQAGIDQAWAAYAERKRLADDAFDRARSAAEDELSAATRRLTDGH